MASEWRALRFQSDWSVLSHQIFREAVCQNIRSVAHNLWDIRDLCQELASTTRTAYPEPERVPRARSILGHRLRHGSFECSRDSSASGERVERLQQDAAATFVIPGV